jgi:hypothetical protein
LFCAELVLANAIVIAKMATKFLNMAVYLFLMLNKRLNTGNKKGRRFG